jgi:hypothetical protein
MSTLNDRLILVNSRVSRLYSRFGLPQAQNVVIVYDNVQTLIDPVPLVQSMDIRHGKNSIHEYFAQSADVRMDDINITNIPRTYPEYLITQGLYLVNAHQMQNGTWVGVEATAKFVDRNQPLTWNVIVRVARER